MKVKELLDKMQTADIEAMQVEVLDANEKALTDLNREQMRRGLTSKGQTISPGLRSFQYAKAKKASGGRAPMGIPDMFNTGAFQHEMAMDADSKSYSFYSTDEKATHLNQKYADIFGLTEDSKRKARELNTAALAVMYRKAVGL